MERKWRLYYNTVSFYSKDLLGVWQCELNMRTHYILYWHFNDLNDEIILPNYIIFHIV